MITGKYYLSNELASLTKKHRASRSINSFQVGFFMHILHSLHLVDRKETIQGNKKVLLWSKIQNIPFNDVVDIVDSGKGMSTVNDFGSHHIISPSVLISPQKIGD